MFTRRQYLELLEREQKEQKLNVHWLLPQGLRDFNKRFWMKYTQLRPAQWIDNEISFEGPSLYEEDQGIYKVKEQKIIDHWITSDGTGYVLVKGVFTKNGPEVEVWFTVEEYIGRETGRMVFYIMKNGLIFQNKYWWFVELFENALGLREKENIQVKEEEVIPDQVSSMHTE